MGNKVIIKFKDFTIEVDGNININIDGNKILVSPKQKIPDATYLLPPHVYGQPLGQPNPYTPSSFPVVTCGSVDTKSELLMETMK